MTLKQLEDAHADAKKSYREFYDAVEGASNAAANRVRSEHADALKVRLDARTAAGLAVDAEKSRLARDRIRDVAKTLKKTMRCNCDLDNWEPEQSTGHSHVCRIHKAAIQMHNNPSPRSKE